MEYYLLNAKVGIEEGGSAPCGPMDPTIVASVRYAKEGERPKWLYCVESFGFPSFYLTEEDIFDKMLNTNASDETFWERLNEESLIDFFDGFPLGEYDPVFEGIYKNPSHPAAMMLRYLIALMRCEAKDTEAILALADGQAIKDIAIPKSDVEESYLEERGE